MVEYPDIAPALLIVGPAGWWLCLQVESDSQLLLSRQTVNTDSQQWDTVIVRQCHSTVRQLTVSLTAWSDSLLRHWMARQSSMSLQGQTVFSVTAWSDSCQYYCLVRKLLVPFNSQKVVTAAQQADSCQCKSTVRRVRQFIVEIYSHTIVCFTAQLDSCQ